MGVFKRSGSSDVILCSGRLLAGGLTRRLYFGCQPAQSFHLLNLATVIYLEKKLGITEIYDGMQVAQPPVRL